MNSFFGSGPEKYELPLDGWICEKSYTSPLQVHVAFNVSGLSHGSITLRATVVDVDVVVVVVVVDVMVLLLLLLLLPRSCGPKSYSSTSHVFPWSSVKVLVAKTTDAADGVAVVVVGVILVAVVFVVFDEFNVGPKDS